MLLDNFYKNTKIVSYDSDKTWIKEEDNRIIFCKKGSQEEVNTQIKIKELLNNKKVIVNDEEYIITCPSVYSYTDGNIEMEFFDGVNLELLLRDELTHKKGVEYINALIQFFIDNKLYWIDFAPRNFLISNNTIMIVDFEKGIMDSDEPLNNYLRNHICEEYGLFLFKEERILDFDSIFKTNEDRVIVVDDISSPRYKCIAKLLGYKDTMTYQEYLNIIKLIIDVEEPYLDNNEFIFNGVILDKVIYDNLDNNPIEVYSKEVIRLSKDK